MASGYKINDECPEAWESLKIKHDCKYFVMKIDTEGDEIKIVGGKNKADGKNGQDAWEMMTSELPLEEGRYVAFDFDYVLKDGGKRNKMIFMCWAPDDAP